MASLEQQYKSWLKANKGSDFTFEDWYRYILAPKLEKAAEQINKILGYIIYITKNKVIGIHYSSK